MIFVNFFKKKNNIIKKKPVSSYSIVQYSFLPASFLFCFCLFLLFFHFHFIPTRSLGLLDRKKTIFKLLHQCGLVDARVKQFVFRNEKRSTVHRALLGSSMCTTRRFRRDDFSLTTNLPRVTTITRVLVLCFYFS